MATTSSTTYRERLVGRTLRRLRERRSLKPAQVSERLGHDRATLSRWETGVTPVGSYDLDKLLDLYRVTDKAQRAVVQRFMADARRNGWAQPYEDLDDQTLIDFLWVERHAIAERAFSPYMVNGTLQTGRYYAAVTELNPENNNEYALARRKQARAERRALLDYPDCPQLQMLMTDEALRCAIGSSEVMREQYDHLLAMIDHPRVEFRVIRFADLPRAGHVGPFTLFQMPEPVPSVTTMDVRGTVFSDEFWPPSEAEAAFASLWRAAEDLDTTAIITEMRGQL